MTAVLQTADREPDPSDDIEAAERAAIIAEPELPPAGTPERAKADTVHRATVAGLLAGFAAHRRCPA